MYKWSDKWKDGALWLLTPEEFKKLPEGTVVHSVNNSTSVVGRDKFDDDTRAGYLAYGIKEPFSPEMEKIFIMLSLSQ